jgi:hypothetical protein
VGEVRREVHFDTLRGGIGDTGLRAVPETDYIDAADVIEDRRGWAGRL